MQLLTPNIRREGTIMFRTFLSVNLVLLLAAAGLNLTAGPGQAAPRGGGHGGGFHGGAQSGGYRGGFSAGTHYGFQPGAHYRTAIHHDRFSRSQFGYYGAWPYFGYSYPAYPNYSDSGYGYSPDLAGADEQSGPDYFPETDSDPIVIAPPSTSPHDGSADITMTLPAGATLWAMGKKIPGTRTTRELHSPMLPAGQRFAYDFRASWKENGETVTQDQTVMVSAGAHVTVHFPVPATKARTAQSR
jgi:uncharacterized protein (TIGR03000 family)